MITLTKDNTATPDAYSSGDGTDPVSVGAFIDGTGIPASVTLAAPEIYLWADDSGGVASYSDVSVSIEGVDVGVVWRLSLDQSVWASSIDIGDLNVSTGQQTVRIYARVTVPNDGSLQTNNYVMAKIKIAATENPA